MAIPEIIHLLPVIILAGGILIILILIALHRHHETTFFMAAGFMTSALITGFFTRPDPFFVIEDLFRIDAFGYFYMIDRKSTRLNSSHVAISYAVFCLNKKKDETV